MDADILNTSGQRLSDNRNLTPIQLDGWNYMLLHHIALSIYTHHVMYIKCTYTHTGLEISCMSCISIPIHSL